MTENMRATLIKVHWEAPDNPWRVCSLREVTASGTCGQRFKGVGEIPNVDPDEVLNLKGEWGPDTRSGLPGAVQFNVTVAARETPTSPEEIVKWFGRRVDGIGKAKAERISNYFGLELPRVLDEQPSRLLEVKGITLPMVSQIQRAWSSDRVMVQIETFLAGNDVNPESWSKKVFDRFGGASIEILKQNPYRFTEIDGIGFRKADEIAMRMGFSKTSPQRIDAAFIHVLNEATNEGHVFLHMGQLVDRVSDLAGNDEDSQELHGDGTPLSVHQHLPRHIVEQALEESVKRGDLYEDRHVFNGTTYVLEYLRKLYTAESKLAERIVELLEVPARTVGSIPALIAEAERVLEIELDDQQRKAVIAALLNSFSIITGGPGTGKSTITKVILYCMEKSGWRVKLAAPTGRAAKRLTEVTSHPAQTVHKLLDYDPKRNRFQRNRSNPLDCEALGFDEWSMGDTELTHYAMEAVPTNCHVFLLGDVDQLPSVGPGMVLRDLIASKHIPVTRLDKIFRQAEGSMIIQNAHKIRRGEHPQFLSRGEVSDCFMMPVPRKLEGKKSVEDVEYVHRMLAKMCQENIPQKYHLDPIKDIQVLAPMKKGTAGVYELNKVLQEALNPNGEILKFGKREFRKGDRVMIFKNNYDLDTFNGDIGFVQEIIELPKVDDKKEVSEVQESLELDTPLEPIAPKMEKFLKLIIDDREVFYPDKLADDIQLAYCQTIHKSQGSEFKAVILVLLGQHYTMLERNLIYTALTRAREMCLFLASKSALEMAVTRCQTKDRNSFLGSRIKLATRQMQTAASVFAIPTQLEMSGDH